MCCFSQRVDRVSGARIFARGVNGRQVLVYSMAYAAQSDLAMVLPLPVPSRPPEDSVRFVNLDGYPEFFEDLERAFPTWQRISYGVDMSASLTTLLVHDVGDFEASFVPCLDDFERLDRRFRIPRSVWDELPVYRDYGFAVFKLKASAGRGLAHVQREAQEVTTRKVHPMAFEFPRRHPELLYFPTVHVHDGSVHPAADFDHVLYSQPEPGWNYTVHLRNWRRTERPAQDHLDIARVQGLVAPAEHCFRFSLAGRRENTDTWLSINPTYPQPVLA